MKQGSLKNIATATASTLNAGVSTLSTTLDAARLVKTGQQMRSSYKAAALAFKAPAAFGVNPFGTSGSEWDASFYARNAALLALPFLVGFFAWRRALPARTVVARVSLRNRDDLLKVGLFGKALVVSTDAAPGAARVVVPLAAVTRIADRDVVFVREPNGHFAVHDVTRGRSAAGKVEIVAGLRAGEQVVSDGVFTLKSAVLKSTFGEED